MQLNLPAHAQRLKTENGVRSVFCQVRKRFVVLTPEEWVRQNMVSHLHVDLGFPVSLMRIERKVSGGARTKRADIVLCNPDGTALMLVECKAPTESLSKETFFQAGRYNRELNAALILISNGMHHYCCKLSSDGNVEFLQTIPTYNEALALLTTYN
jgi:hypothetical protein